MEAGARTAGRRRLVGQSRGGVKRAGRKDDRGSQGERRGGKAAGDRALPPGSRAAQRSGSVAGRNSLHVALRPQCVRAV